MRSVFAMFGIALFVAVQSLAVAATPVAVSGGSATLSPDNTKIQFVGTHSPPKQPDPRTGGFAKFKGKAEVDAATKALKAVSVEIETSSLFTEIGDRLTNHLKSPDFFSVREYPKATFESTKIAAGTGGKATITGKLSLHGVTKEISFPATVEVGEKGLTLTSEFSIDRTQFGMNYGLAEGGVEPKVSMKVVVGEKTTPK
jgi:polyisoprenoid-binding protein YceI